MTLPSPLLLVTERRLGGDAMVETLAACVAAGAPWIWLRDRDLAQRARKALALRLKAASDESLILSVGGDLDLAEEFDAAGVHLPAGADVAAARRRLGSKKLVGLSAHGVEDIRRARGAGADYATLSPIFPSVSKPNYGPALGLEAIAEAAAVGLPIIALGGVNSGNARDCLAAGAAAVAVIGAVLSATDPVGAARAILSRINGPGA